MSVPDKFQGFGVDDKENWNKPKLVEYERKSIGPNDVVVKNIACGLCYSDIHTLQGNWAPLNRKGLVVGHEIVGDVISVGDKVTLIKVGQRVGIGAKSSSCMTCHRCQHDNEQYCRKSVGTYNSKYQDGYVSQGGYSSHSIANEMFVFPLPENLDPYVAAPLMGVGLTVFSLWGKPWAYGPRVNSVAIIGIGGLGHLAIQFANAIGAEVWAFSRSSSKKQQALDMGATGFVATAEDKDWYKKYLDKFDMVLNCGSGVEGLNLDHYLNVSKVECKFISVGLPPTSEKFSVSPFTFLSTGGSFGATALGSKKEVLKMFQIAADKGVKPWIEKVPISEENVAKALDRCEAGDVRYRFVFTELEKAFKL